MFKLMGGWLSILLLLFSSCATDTTKKETFQFPFWQDTISFETDYVALSVSANEKPRAIYTPFYIGPWKDSIFIDYMYSSKKSSTSRLPPPPPPPLPGEEYIPDVAYDSLMEVLRAERDQSLFRASAIDGGMGPNYKHTGYDSVEIKLLVDTSKVIHSIDFLPIPGHCFKAYPLMIQNLGLDTIVIGGNIYIPIIMEKRDSVGNWVDVEQQRMWGCGHGILEMLLPPKQLLVSSVKIYPFEKGTAWRLKLGEHRSEVFESK